MPFVPRFLFSLIFLKMFWSVFSFSFLLLLPFNYTQGVTIGSSYASHLPKQYCTNYF